MISGKTGLVIGIILLLVATPIGIIWFVVYGIMHFRRGGGSVRGGMGVGGSVDEMRSFPQGAQQNPSPSTSGTWSAPTREVAQQILGRVKAGEERLSVSTLSEELGISQSEVRRAIADLRARGLIR